MFEKIKRLFGLDYESTLERERKEYLSHLSIPSSKVVIGSPRYQPAIFNCEIIVDTSHLLDWLTDHYSRCSVSFNASVLLSWLPSATANDGRLTYLDGNLLSAIEGYEERLIELRQAKVICGECNGVFSDITQDRLNVKDEGNWHSGTIIWKCPRGHLIYNKDYRFHALR